MYTLIMNSELIIDDVMIECCNWQKKRFGVLPVKSSGAITSLSFVIVIKRPDKRMI